MNCVEALANRSIYLGVIAAQGDDVDTRQQVHRRKLDSRGWVGDTVRPNRFWSRRQSKCEAK